MATTSRLRLLTFFRIHQLIGRGWKWRHLNSKHPILASPHGTMFTVTMGLPEEGKGSIIVERYQPAQPYKD